MLRKHMPKQLSQAARKITHTTRAAWNDIRFNWLGQAWPAKPATLNLLVNDICNSHCQMCLIWERKRDKELTPDELEALLRDPLFRRLKYVGVSGGEPTLRKDLPDIFRVLANKRPRITGAGIITNAIQAETVIERVTAAAEICEKAGIRFNVMVSLDGVGQIHDQIRGRAGNFESAMQVINYFRQQTHIPVIFGCTITKDNVWHVDELLDFAREENLYGRFRVAEYIQRLYNDSQTQYIRNFSAEESYHLALFFTKLEREFEASPIYQRTYRNIRSMLHEATPRTIRCPYQSNAVVLDSRGQMLYCSPKSPVLGSAFSNLPAYIPQHTFHAA
jgi:MoaA/NifB/PqqE/SkfB family radical SAM enzyme